jgi:putative oxidoreductase
LALLLGVWTRLTALVLRIWCIVTAVTGHSNFADLDMQIHFMKNLAMAGGFAYMALFGAGAYSLDRFLGPFGSAAVQR